jgi:competence protein ComEC
MNTNIKWWWLLIATLIAATTISFISSWPKDKVQYIQCDVKQGDAVLIQKRFAQVVYDTGDGDHIFECLERYMPFFDRTINLIIISHEDKDHRGSLSEIMKRYQVKYLIWNGKKGNFSDEIDKYLTEEEGLVVKSVKDISKVELSGIDISFIWPTDYKNLEEMEDNESSVVVKVDYQDFEILLTGDISEEIEKELVNGDNDLKADVIKISHHGSKKSSNNEFLTEVGATIATIGVGKNSYGHPNKEVIERLGNLGAQVWRTDEVGDIVLESDGIEYWKME